MKRYSTGITVLDSSLGGGIPSGSLVLIVEKPGAGAEILSFQFAVEGVRRGESVLYVTTSETDKNTLEHVRVYFPDFGENEKFKLVSLVSVIKGDARTFLRNSIIDPLSYLKKTLSNSRFDRIIIYTLNDLIRSYSDDEVVSLVEELSLKVKNDESVALLTLVEGTVDKRTENVLKSIADAIFELDVQERENEIQRKLKIIKIRRCKVPKNVFRYDITERGVKMESLMRVI